MPRATVLKEEESAGRARRQIERVRNTIVSELKRKKIYAIVDNRERESGVVLLLGRR